MPDDRRATLFRMVLPEHTCPFGVRAKALLEEHGYEVDDRVLQSRDEVEAFKAEHDVTTTPQIFLDEERIGGSDDLERRLAQADAR
jgi:glutaredoxin 3